MLSELTGLKFNVEFFHTVENDNPCLLYLHGFTGSTNDWNEIYPHINTDFSSVGIDLPGHGLSSSPDNPSLYSAEAVADQIKFVVDNAIKKKVIPIGYSMGGRAALTFAVHYPDMIEALILESATPGVSDEKLREERIKKDESIADYILTHSLEEFADYWMNMEIFNTQRRFSEVKRNQIKQNKMKNNPVGLANSLKGFGTGIIPPLYDHLKNIKYKTLLITGELDSRFTGLNSEIVNLFPDAEHKIIKNAGHNTHLEEPERFIAEVNNFLQSIRI